MELPSGLASSLATLATNFDVPTPTEAVRPSVVARTSSLSCPISSSRPVRLKSTAVGRCSEVDEGLVQGQRLHER